MRLTVIEYEKKKIVIDLPKGSNLYIGRQIVDINEKGFSDLSEIDACLKQILEDSTTTYKSKIKSVVEIDNKAVDSYPIGTTFDRGEWILAKTKLNKSVGEDFVLDENETQKRLNFLIAIIVRVKEGALGNPNIKAKAVQKILDFKVDSGLKASDVTIKGDGMEIKVSRKEIS